MKHVLLMTLGTVCCLFGLMGIAAGAPEGGVIFLVIGGVILALRYKKWKAWYGRRKSLSEEFAETAKALSDVRKPVSAKIIGANEKTGNVVGRAFVGNVVAGLSGAVIGAATAKNKEMTKFLVTYADGHKAVETVKDNSLRFKELIEVLDES